MILPLGDDPNPPGVPVVTYALILANCAVYIFLTLPLGFVRPDPSDPLVQEYLGAMFEAMSLPPSARAANALFSRLTEYDLLVFQWGFRPVAPQIPTLFTAMFLHSGFLHLAGNMLFLWIYGDNVEYRLGRVRFLAAYLGTGVAATLFHTLFAGQALLPLLGASGAISGVLGVYFLWFPRNRVRLWVMLFPFFMQVVYAPARWVLGFYVLVDNFLPLLAAAGTRGGGVAYGAHIGGFFGGLLVAWFVNRRSLLMQPESFAGAGRPEGRVPIPGSLAALLAEGDFEAAARRYVSLSSSETRQLLSERDSLVLGTWMASKGHPHAALVLFQRHIRDYPIGPTAAEAHVGAGLLQLRTFSQPTAAYQHLVEALGLDPNAETAQRARQGLDQIAALKKFRLNAF